MVMIALNHTVLTDINGKLGGGHYKYDKCGLHFQTNPRRRRAATEYELVERKFFQIISHHWGTYNFKGTKEDRASWNEYGKQHPKKNKKGETVKLSGYLAFKSVNIPRLIENQPILYHAPGITTPPPPPRLGIEAVLYHNVSLVESEVYIFFPQEMKTGLVDTPPLADFEMHLSMFDDKDFPLWRWTPISKEWISNHCLKLTFNTRIWQSGYIVIRYRRGNRPFKTLAADRAYGSFKIFITGEME